MPELVQTVESMNKVREDERVFLASLQGVDLKEERQEQGPTFDDVRRRALGVKANADDVVSLQGAFASEAGFGIGMGLGYSRSS
jgi:hypothetical protein